MMDRLNTGKAPIDVLLLVIVALVGAFYALTLRDGHVWGDDFAQYILHAKNIAEGRSYSYLPLIINPFNYIGPETYPPLLPLVLAPFYYLFGLDLTVMKLVLIAVFCAGLIFIGLVFRDRLPDSRRYALIVLFAMNPWLWEMKDAIQSEYLYILTSMVCLFLMHRHYQQQDGARSLASGLVIGMSIYLAYATREIGIVLLATLLVIEVFRKHSLGRYFFVAAGVFALLAVTQQSLLLLGHEDIAVAPEVLALERASGVERMTNVDLLLTNVQYFTRQALKYLEAAKDFWSPHHVLGLLLAAITGVLALAGFMRQLLSRITVFEIYFTGYCLALLLYGGFQGVRYLIPVMPLYLYYVMLGLGVVDMTGVRRLSQSLLMLIMLCATVVYADSYRGMNISVIEGGVSTPESTGLLDYVRASIRPDDLIVFAKPRALALLTDRITAIHPVGEDSKLVFDYLVAIDADMGRVILRPVIEEKQENFTPVYEIGQFTVYRFDPAAGGPRWRDCGSFIPACT